MFIDAHNHLLAVFERLPIEGTFNAATLKAQKISLQFVNSIRDTDWAELQILARTFPQDIFPFFGIHPWMRPTTQDWLVKLKHLIISITDPSIPFPPGGIGEIGLDSRKSPLPLLEQEKLLIAQLEIAREFDLPVTLHTNGTASLLYPLLYPTYSNLRLLLHSFTEDCRWAKKFLDKGAYFSFGGTIFYPQRARAREIMRYIPTERLLLETDAPDMLPPAFLRKSAKTCNTPENLPAIYQAIAAERGTLLPVLTEQLAINAQNFLQKPIL